MSESPRVSPAGLDAELAATVPPPDLPAEGLTVNGRTFRPVLERQQDGTLGQTKHAGSNGTYVYKMRLASGVPGHDPVGEFALKWIPRGPTNDRGLREASVLRALKHPNIVRYEDAEQTDGAVLLVTEWCEGTPLTRFCTDVYTEDERLALFLQVCDAIQQAHALVVYHRDLKPPHVVARLETVGGRPRTAVTVLDFDNAVVGNPIRATAATGTDPTITCRGTTAYASPNQHRGGAPLPPDDQDARGVLLGELLTGVAPPGGGRPWTERGGLSLDLFRIIRKATASIPERQYPTVETFREDLHRYRRGRILVGVAQGPLTRVSKFARRHLGPVIVAVLLAAFAAFSMFQRQTASRERERAEGLAQVYRDDIAGFGRAEDVKRMLSAAPGLWTRPAGQQYFTLLKKAFDGKGEGDEKHDAWRGAGYAELAEIYRHLGAHSEALLASEAAIRIHRDALTRYPRSAEHRFRLAAALRRAAEVLVGSDVAGHLDRAAALADEAVGAAEALADGGTVSRFRGRKLLALTLNSRGNVAATRSRPGKGEPHDGQLRDRAEADFRDALGLWDEVAFDPAADIEDQLQRARVRNQLGRLWLTWARFPDAEREFGEGRKSAAGVFPASESDRRKYRQAVAYMAQGLGESLAGQSKADGAGTAFDEALAIRTDLWKLEPGSPELCIDLARTRLARARLAQQTDPTLARKELSEAVAVLKEVLDNPMKKMADVLEEIAELQK